MWRKEDELIPRIILIRPRVLTGELVKYESQELYAIAGADPRPLVIRDSVSLLALSARRIDHQLEEVERRLGASQLEFQEAMIKKCKSLQIKCH